GPGRGAAVLAAGAAGAAAAGAAGAAAGLSAAAFLAAAFLAGAFLAGSAGSEAAPPAALSCSPYSFLKRITTGGSTVEDADFTNSPISLSFSRTTLLSTPSSLASSWTRGLATLLLLAPSPGPAGLQGGARSR